MPDSSSLRNASWIHTLPDEIRIHILVLLGIHTSNQHSLTTSALLDGISLSLAYPQFVELCRYTRHSLQCLPVLDRDEVTRLSELLMTAASLSKDHDLLKAPKAFKFDLCLLESYPPTEPYHQAGLTSLSRIYKNVLQLCPNMSAVTVISTESYSYCALHDDQLMDLLGPIAHQLHELQLSLPADKDKLFELLQNSLRNANLQKVTIDGFMSGGSTAFLKEQRKIRQFKVTEVNADALEQVVQYWPMIEDIDLSGMQLISASNKVCKAIYQSSNQLKRLTLTGASDVEIRACLAWMTDDDDDEIVIEKIGNAYRSVIGCCTSITHLSISKLPMCGNLLLPLLRNRLSKLEEMEFISGAKISAA